MIKIFKITENGDQLNCLHSIRFLSLAWVILCHTYIYGLGLTSMNEFLLIFNIGVIARLNYLKILYFYR